MNDMQSKKTSSIDATITDLITIRDLLKGTILFIIFVLVSFGYDFGILIMCSKSI